MDVACHRSGAMRWAFQDEFPNIGDIMRCLTILAAISGFACGCGPADPKTAMEPKIEKVKVFLRDYCDTNLRDGLYPGGSPESTGGPFYVEYDIRQRDDLVIPYVCNLKLVVKEHTKNGGYGDVGVDFKSDWDGRAWSNFSVFEEGFSPYSGEIIDVLSVSSPQQKADQLQLYNFNKKLLEDIKTFMESL
jgi:hypothetical protein